MKKLMQRIRPALAVAMSLPVLMNGIPAQAGPGYAMSFNGVDNYVWINRPVSNDFTIEFWFNSTQVAGTNTQWWQGMGLVDGEVNGAYADFGVSLGAGAVVFGTGGAGDVSVRSGVVADGKWHHVAATRVRTNGWMRLYVDGALVSSGTGSTVSLTAPAQMRFGSLASGVNYYKGLLDEVKIWSVARSQGQIQAGMFETPGRGDADLAGYWPFREGPGGMQTADFSGHGQHGRMVNRPVWRPSPMVWARGIQLAGTLLTTNECHEAFVDAGAALECAPVHLSSRGYQSQGVRADGTVAGWGANLLGQTNMPPPWATNAVATASSGLHSLALRADGTVVGWGDNQYNKASVPGTITNAVAVAAGNFASVALRADGTVTMWGWGQTGEFAATYETNVVAIGSGYTHNIYLHGDGTVGGWGSNTHGELDVPAGATNVVAISVGDNHSLALRADGSVMAWGYNEYGQTNVPAAATNVVAISAGFGHNLVLKGDGTVLGWGDNANGELNVPAGVSNVVGVVAGQLCSFVLMEDGRTAGWGGNYRNVTKVPPGLGLVPHTGPVVGKVDPNNPGSYSLSYVHTNLAGVLLETNRTVVVADRVGPVVRLNGVNPVVITNLNRAYVDEGATAWDACGGNFPLTTNNTVKVGAPGTYSIRYESVDSYGNTGRVERVVCVALPPVVPGDLNGDGVVDTGELGQVIAGLHAGQGLQAGDLSQVLARYPLASGDLQMTNVAGLGGAKVDFSLVNGLLPVPTVERSADLGEWEGVGTAVVRHGFADTNAPAAPQRYYRLRRP